MSDRAFLDTNIFVYVFDAGDRTKAAFAAALIERMIRERSAVISHQVIQEFYSVAFRRFQPPMALADAEDYLLTSFRRIPTVSQSLGLVLSAIRLMNSHRLAWYDSLIVAAALEAECGILYTEDFQHGRRFGNLEVRNPFIS
jgi:predicted nucleic acid-binding protein